MSCTFNANSTVIADNKTHSPNPLVEKQETFTSSGRSFIDITALSNRWKNRIVPELREMGKDVFLGITYTSATIFGIGIRALNSEQKLTQLLTPAFVGSTALISTAFLMISAELEIYKNANILKKIGYFTGLLAGYSFVKINLDSFPSEMFLTILPLYFSGPTGVMIEGIFERKYFSQKPTEEKAATVHIMPNSAFKKLPLNKMENHMSNMSVQSTTQNLILSRAYELEDIVINDVKKVNQHAALAKLFDTAAFVSGTLTFGSYFFRADKQIIHLGVLTTAFSILANSYFAAKVTLGAAAAKVLNDEVEKLKKQAEKVH